MATVILYLPQKDGSGEDLFRMIKKAMPDGEFEIYGSIGRLSLRLRQPMPDVGVVILCFTNSAELNRMMGLAEILNHSRVLMILPNNRADVICKALVFRPQFIAATEDALQYLGYVLENMSSLYGNASLAH